MTYWTYETSQGIWFDAEFETAKEAEKWADNEFAEQSEEAGYTTNSARSTLVNFSWDENGEMVIHKMLPLVLEYEREMGYA